MSSTNISKHLFESLARPLSENAKLDEPGFADQMLAALKPDITRVLLDPTWRHGRRVQSMFEAMVVAFDSYTLIKTEDAGTLQPADQYSLPDFRVVLKDGSQILVEVKNEYRTQPFNQRFGMRASDLEKKQKYAVTMGVPLKLAIYWARWGLWSLVDPKHLEPRGNKLGIEMMRAMQFNETALFGDQSIGTRLPLTLRFVADRANERLIAVDGQAAFTIGGVEVLCQGNVLTGLDRELALLVIQYGELEGEGPVAVTSGALLDAIDFNFVHPEPANEDFEIVGSASRMFSRYYATRTIAKGQVVRTAFPLQPGLFRVLTVGDGTGKTLPLWRFIQRPAGGKEPT